jgi:L-alanine-DL-glutamate epimerase-like enolase superfamily enzyme
MENRTVRNHDGKSDAAIEKLLVTVYKIPTDGPDGKESDGTLEWSASTLVLVEIQAGKTVGIGYTYANAAAATLIDATLKGLVEGKDPLRVCSIWRDQMSVLRNTGRPGIGSMAVSAVDIALWDLKAKLLGLPLFCALGAFHDEVPVYGSGGFCAISNTFTTMFASSGCFSTAFFLRREAP